MNIPMSVMAEHWKGTVAAAICPGNYPSSLQPTKKKEGYSYCWFGIEPNNKSQVNDIMMAKIMQELGTAVQLKKFFFGRGGAYLKRLVSVMP